MTRTTVSGIRPDKTGTSEWIDINSHVGRLMSTIMAGGRPFSIDADPAGMTIVTLFTQFVLPAFYLYLARDHAHDRDHEKVIDGET